MHQWMSDLNLFFTDTCGALIFETPLARISGQVYL